jgi:thiol-disulfide isomerase/thioredoxin
VVQGLYDRYDPYDPANMIATTSASNSYAKSVLRKSKILPSDDPKRKTWSQYDGKFGMVVSQISFIDYAPENIQMFFVGNSLLTASIFKPMSDEDFKEVFNTYQNLFPNSPYLPLINDYLEESAKANIQESNQFKFGVYSFSDKDNLLKDEKFPGIDTVTTIQSLIQTYFKGNPVFVDFWATWCSPCVAEFGNEPELHKFLQDRNVSILYVSIDNIKSMNNWKKSVSKYGLTGYHYLANQNVYTSLNKWFLGIPRYMLFNADGKVVKDNLPRPSKKEELFIQIDEQLNAK